LGLYAGEILLCSQALCWSHYNVHQRGQFRKTESTLGTARPRRADGSWSTHATQRYGPPATQQTPCGIFWRLPRCHCAQKLNSLQCMPTISVRTAGHWCVN